MAAVRDLSRPDESTIEVATPSAPPRRRPLDLYYAALIAAAVLSGGLASVHLGRPPLWRDEAWSYAIADRSFVGILRVLFKREFNMGLYYVLLHPWTAIGGSSEVWVRSMSVLFAALTVVVFGATVARL